MNTNINCFGNAVETNQNQLKMKQKYDSSVVYLYATGNENFLPKEFREQIPYTTIANWRKTDYSSYIGNEFRYFFDEAIESAEMKYRYRHIKRLLMSLARSLKCISVWKYLPYMRADRKVNVLWTFIGRSQTAGRANLR